MPETTPLRVLLLCDREYNAQPLQYLASLLAQSSSLRTMPISKDIENCSIDDSDVVIIDISGLAKHAIAPAELGDILYAYVPTVLVGQVGDSSLAMDGIRAGAQCWFCLLYTSPSPRDRQKSRMPSSA